MNTKLKFAGVLALAAVVTPVVIGRFGGEFAGLLRVDVLAGLGVVATLVALITLEYGRVARVSARPAALRVIHGGACQPRTGTFASLPAGAKRAA